MKPPKRSARERAKGRWQARNRVNWGLVLALAAPGVAMGAASLFGWYGFSGELFLWLALAALLWVPALVASRTPKPLRTGVATGLLAGASSGFTQAAFATTYLQNNPQYAAGYESFPLPLTAAILFLSGAFYGAVLGLLAGAAAWAVRRRID